MTKSDDDSKFDLIEFMKFKPLVGAEYPIPDQALFRVMIHGEKGSSKTTTALSIAGDVLVFSYEDIDNVTDIIKGMFDNDPRFQVKDFEQFKVEETGETLKETSEFIFDLSIKLMKILISRKMKFDWFVADGFHNLADTAQMKMRKKNGVGAFAGVKNRNIWNERKIFLNEFFRLAKKVSRYGVIFTSQDKITETTDGTKVEPAWMGKIKDDMKTLIRTSVKERNVGSKTVNSFYANVISCKPSGISGSAEITVKEDKENKGQYLNSPIDLWRALLTTRKIRHLKW